MEQQELEFVETSEAGDKPVYEPKVGDIVSATYRKNDFSGYVWRGRIINLEWPDTPLVYWEFGSEYYERVETLYLAEDQSDF